MPYGRKTKKERLFYLAVVPRLMKAVKINMNKQGRSGIVAEGKEGGEMRRGVKKEQ